MSGSVPLFPSPPAEAGIFQPFWEAIATDRLALPRCPDCGRWVWYPAPRCPDCSAVTLEWAPVAGTGTLFTYTVVHRSFLSDVTLSQPFVVGLVELDGAPGVRLVADLDVAPDDVRVGMRLEARFETAGGRRRPVFAPAGEGEASPAS